MKNLKNFINGYIITFFMWFNRMAIEKESPEEYGYEKIKYNLAESSVPDQPLNLFIEAEKLINILPSYGYHKGKPELRKLIVQQYEKLSPENILVTNGAAEALFVVEATLLKPDDKIVVLHPNYPSNYEAPKSLGCDEKLISLKFEENFELNLDELTKMVDKDVKLVSLTYPNNPTGAMLSENELREIVEMVEDCGCYLLMDETYRELSHGNKLPTVASLTPLGISVSTLSKAYGTPGIRIGWIATRDDELMEKLIAAKEQINICNSVIDEEIAVGVLRRRDILEKNMKRALENLKVLSDWMEEERHLEWIPPKGGLVCFPRIKENMHVDVSRFYSILLEKYRTFVGPGHWFNMPDSYLRIGYGWYSPEEFYKGLENISKALKEAEK